MEEKNYLQWLSSETITQWWHDSGDPAELERGKANGAVGVTTNPVLSNTAINDNIGFWENEIQKIGSTLTGRDLAEFLTSCVVKNAASMFEEIFNRKNQQSGFVCGQIDPALGAEREAMIEMAERFSRWTQNVSVKFPATAAGLDAFEESVAKGISCTSTVSFTVPQVIAAAERYEKGKKRAEQAGIRPKPGYAVIMIGRIDDYLREIIKDRGADISESYIKQAGIAVTKRSYKIFRERDYKAKLIIAALRGPHHMTSVCGADLIMSIHPKIQKILLDNEISREHAIDEDVDPKVVEKLKSVPEFIKAYEEDGMNVNDFITFGVCQKTMSQFHAGGWKLMELFKIK